MAKADLLVLGSTLPKQLGDSTPSFVLDLAIRQHRDFEVTLLSPGVPGAAKSETIEGVKIERFSYWPFRQTLADGAILDNLKAKKSNWLQVPFLLLGLWRAITKQQPKLIHAHWIIPQGLIATLAAPKAKLLVTTHGGDIYALNNPLIKAIKIWVLKRTAAVSTVNSQMRDQLISWGITPDKIHVLPMGVDISAAKIENQKRTPNTILVVGRLVEKKGIEYLLAAIKKGVSENRLPPGIKLLIAGDGPIRKDLEHKASGLPVQFLGRQSKQQVRKLYATSAVAILPSVTAKSGDQEGLPVTLLEAAAAGAFVIASNLPGINEVIQDRQTGLLIEQRDSEGILAGLEVAFSSSAENKKLVASCKKELAKLVEQYDHDVVGAKYNALLASIE